MQNTQTMIHGLRRGLGLLVELMTDVVEQCGLGDFGQRLGRLLEPAGEVQQVIGVSAERTQRELANALSIEKGVGPGHLLSLRIEQAIGGGAGGGERLVDQRKVHKHCADWRQAAKSAAVAPAAK